MKKQEKGKEFSRDPSSTDRRIRASCPHQRQETKMLHQHQSDVKRRQDGSIDTDAYVSEARRLRHAEIRENVHFIASILASTRRDALRLPAGRLAAAAGHPRGLG
jgi:hypothetical protein